METKKAVIIGASGLVGGHLLNELLQNQNYSEVTILVRKKIDFSHSKLKQQIFDFENIDSQDIITDEIFCAIGTTLSKAGSKAAQYHIDCEIPYAVAKNAFANGAIGFFLISSLGADAKSSNFYLNTKGQLEEKVKGIGFETFVTARPSILAGVRNENRIGEKIGLFISKIIEPLLLGSLKKYAVIEASTVAKAIVKIASSNQKGIRFIESDALKNIANSSSSTI
ncbi:MAG: NAD-dependent epimerase/dehydratase family protein [Bacteroidota bacterium]